MKKFLVTFYEGGIYYQGRLLWEKTVKISEKDIIFLAGKKLKIKKSIISDMYDKSNMDIDYVINVEEIEKEEEPTLYLLDQLTKKYEQIEELKGFVRKMEWISIYEYCPECEGRKRDGHKKNCKLEKAIYGLNQKLNKMEICKNEETKA